MISRLVKDERFEINNCAVALDGGSWMLIGKSKQGEKIKIDLPQHGIKANFRRNLIPGRLHYNEIPVEVRSDREKQIVSQLQECISSGKVSNDVKEVVEIVVRFVLSEEYLTIAEKFKKYPD